MRDNTPFYVNTQNNVTLQKQWENAEKLMLLKLLFNSKMAKMECEYDQ